MIERANPAMIMGPAMTAKDTLPGRLNVRINRR
jgi:hypothetical protein